MRGGMGDGGTERRGMRVNFVQKQKSILGWLRARVRITPWPLPWTAPPMAHPTAPLTSSPTAPLVSLLMMSLLLTSCQRMSQEPARRVPTTKDPGSVDPKPIPPSETCENRWIDQTQWQEPGLLVAYLERESWVTKQHTHLYSESVTVREVLSKSPEVLVWKKQTESLAPETGTTQSEFELSKSRFIELCRWGIDIQFTDRPVGKKPTSVKRLVKEWRGQDYEMLHEVYDFSGGHSYSEKDILEVWVGAAASYKGLVFSSVRRTFRISPEPGYLVTQKELQTLRFPEL